MGTMISFWINYASLTQGNSGGVYELPLALQAVPAVFVFSCCPYICGAILTYVPVDAWWLACSFVRKGIVASHKDHFIQAAKLFKLASPRWYARKDYWERARDTLAKLSM